ncbi:MAG: hypothetical protein BM555_03575 [Crocinitomix sp. MedPE-SWsnd]|nr:MAG: hypothetical protein BM555_03575 [Crocinitomix sp. MedPE-SWsnd]
MKKKKYSVCIIDDSTVDIFITKTVLKEIPEIGEIFVFHDPEKALEFVEKERESNLQFPDLILLDIMMPVIDGFEWIDEVDEMFDDDFQPKIFMLSHTDMQKDFERFQKQKLSSVLLKKPLKKDEFLEHLQKEFNESETKTVFSRSPRL